jgi:two-component system chemotaxis response regulator CheY
MYYRATLEAAGFRVEEAMNGLEALEKLLTTPVDLLIVDVNMPQMDGLTFLRVLRRQEMPTAGIPALVTSSESGPQDIEAARTAGANYYLVKPLSQETLAEYADMFCGITR